MKDMQLAVDVSTLDEDLNENLANVHDDRDELTLGACASEEDSYGVVPYKEDILDGLDVCRC